jgi:hypothetical protein
LLTAGSDPYGITAGPDGALWFTEQQSNNIGRITTSGVITEFAILTANSESYFITAGPDGALWFTEQQGNNIGRITTAGVITEFPIPTASSLPFGITTGPDGALWFTEYDHPGANKIGRLVPPISVTAPVITANPTNQTINAGQVVTFTAAATGTPTPTVQWQQSTGAGNPFTNISRATSTTYSFTPTVAQSGYQYQAVFTNSAGSATTTAATLIVNPAPAAPVAVNETATTGAVTPVSIDLSVGATGSPISAAIVSGPVHGTINVISGTKITYTPSICFTGTDTFTFTLANASGTSNVAMATITVTTGSAGTFASVYLIDPFLLTQNLGNVDLTPLYQSLNWTSNQALGLVADNTSAAIAIMQTNDCTHDVTFTTTNSTTLLPYTSNFLTTTPVAGKSSLAIPAKQLLNVNGLLYAAVLVKAPVGVVASFTAPIVVAAEQGTKTVQAQMAMVPPPVLLVHGLWGDQNSLAGVAFYLVGTPPWETYPEFVRALCYSKYFGFDALNDPLSINSSDPCEQTSKDAFVGAISSLTGTLDHLQIVGSRVDVVGHSMGGLALRNYASQALYRSLRNRQQGDFHEIITLDTPEQGSELATFLVDHNTCVQATPNGVWQNQCGLLPTITVAQCFAGNNRPLSALNQPIESGAVYSLIPPNNKNTHPNLSLANPKLSPPNIAGADWLAVDSIAPSNSSLEWALNNFLLAINRPIPHPGCMPISGFPTVNKILGTPNDAIVNRLSQLAGNPKHTREFQGLSHTAAGFSFPSLYSDANVLQSAEVNQLVACWLSRPGDTGCLKAIPAKQQSAPAPQTLTVGASYVDRLAIKARAGLVELGTPFDLPVDVGGNSLPEFQVMQRGEMGEPMVVPATISTIDGQVVHLNVTPFFYGETGFRVVARYPNGVVASKDIIKSVNLPSEPPTELHASFPIAVINLNYENPSIRLGLWATYADIPTLYNAVPGLGTNVPRRVYLDAQYVSYSVAPAGGPPVVDLDAVNGIVYGLRPGTATIVGQYGAVTDQMLVIVKAEAEK